MPKANWIWSASEDRRAYNQTIVTWKTFNVDELRSAVLSITADSAYRLFINDAWVGDGPARAWPEHYQYDRLDVTSYLHAGENQIRVIAKFWGTGTFHQVPQQPGLLVQLDLDPDTEDARTIVSDESWQVAEARAWAPNTPKISIQMAPQELYDARLEDNLAFEPASVLFEAEAGPWADLHPRDVPMLTKTPVTFRAFREANVVRRRRDLHLCIPTARLAHPGLIEANHNVIQAGGIATILQLEEDALLQIGTDGLKIWIDGEAKSNGAWALSAGEHPVLAFVSDAVGHQKEKTLHVADPPGSMKLINPLATDDENPWCWIAFPDYAYAENDLRRPNHGYTEELDQKLQAYLESIEELGQSVKEAATFKAVLGERAQCLPTDRMFVRDTHWRFLTREPVADARGLVGNPSGLIYDNAEVTVIHPSDEGDVELVYDLGEQVVGYYDLELVAEAGVKIDIYGVEYIAPDGRIQHTRGNRNGVRYITREGVNRFTSTRRRSGRYLFVTLRDQTEPVAIRKLQVIAATYPINAVGDFRCSDGQLTRIWEISARTLKLCMEDTFTDCPLYEQTLWVGDARNESVFAYPVFDATDIGARCIKLAGQSLERYPIVGCQVPSSWDVLLPAWSFLWGISVWDYYEYTGDDAFLAEAWPWVKQNLRGAAELRDPETGLFKGPFWNMFDWSGIDDNHEIVLHNSMLMVGAINAARRCAEVLGDQRALPWLHELREALCASINRLWD
ncbi:MAG: family 78 glycoside hydrolase catalytic domain, partial [Anaerolineae bacterium]